MTKQELQHRETLLLETLLSALDARETAKAAGATLLCYLTELLVQRARDELEAIREKMEKMAGEGAANGDASA